jgi:hypothetical protein
LNPPEGRITLFRQRVCRKIAPNVVTYDVVVSAPNPDLLLLPGLTANVRIITAHRHSVLRVPNAALRFRPSRAASPERATSPGQGQVFALNTEGKPELRTIKVGISDTNVTEVVEGLEAGASCCPGASAPDWAFLAQLVARRCGYNGPVREIGHAQWAQVLLMGTYLMQIPTLFHASRRMIERCSILSQRNAMAAAAAI